MAITIVVDTIAHLCSPRKNIHIIIIAVAIANRKAIAIYIEAFIDHTIAVIISPVTDFGRTGEAIWVVVITIAITYRKAIAIGIRSRIGWTGQASGIYSCFVAQSPRLPEIVRSKVPGRKAQTASIEQ
jgi:hypothetical protein